jgi:hypothetical protein
MSNNQRFSLYVRFLSMAIHYSDCYGPKKAAKARSVILRINALAIREGWHYMLANCYRNTPWGISQPGATIKA